jgi:hypothetical protein
MGSDAGGEEVFSVMQYTMKHWPNGLVGMLRIYDGQLTPLIAWCTGFAYALSVVEDNGVPVDLDEVLHNWQNDYPYPIRAEVERWIQEHPYGI